MVSKEQNYIQKYPLNHAIAICKPKSSNQKEVLIKSQIHILVLNLMMVVVLVAVVCAYKCTPPIAFPYTPANHR